MPSYEVCGAIRTILEAKTFASGFTKREFVLLTEDDYPQTVLIGCVKQKCALLDRVAPNDRVRVTFQLRGREYQGRYFVNLEADQIEKMGADGSSVAMEEAPPPADDDPMPF